MYCQYKDLVDKYLFPVSKSGGAKGTRSGDMFRADYVMNTLWQRVGMSISLVDNLTTRLVRELTARRHNVVTRKSLPFCLWC